MAAKHFPNLPNIGLTFPSSPLIDAASTYASENTAETTWNHTVRSAYYAVILSKKLPQYANVDIEAVIVSCILHDLGWATTAGLGSPNLRFEVDGAEIARKWVREQTVQDGEHYAGWDKYRQQVLWDSIALHTQPSIAPYKEPEVALTHLGITADFVGDQLPGGAITREEVKEVIRTFPRLEFKPAGFKKIMCELCMSRSNTTSDNFISDFGVRYGYDGEGKGKEEFIAKMKQANVADMLMGALEYSETIVREIEAEHQ